MNSKQKITLLFGIIIIILMGIYPPWCLYLTRGGEKFPGSGYAFFTTPIPTGRDDFQVRADIDYTRLSFQWAMLVIVTGGFILMFKDKKKVRYSDDNQKHTQ